MPVCPECGAINSEGSFTCGTCGSFLSAGEAPPEARPASREGEMPPRAASEWTPEMASEVPPPERGTAPRQHYTPPTKVKMSSRTILAVAGGLVLLVGVVVVLVLVFSGGSGNTEEAIQLVKDYLDNQDELFDSSMFKDWEASGKGDDIEVSAIFDISTFGEEYGGVPGGYYNTRMSWKVNLDNGSVQPLSTGGC